ncbi:hypothetical protein ASG52_10635 [Methylobacterium sp. Leaf456]|uniref:hypothetical protein n=1 Tax=Methylobacterium sp. Leaf456 TaxID=1736382 RepID=UPI0006FCC4DD|nr:hypothetical protein [Methylobacterium sp. Leaf456]KQT47722.1 hypothetical protein ASG52_10635 [Methylobacterium sp. Leaf456]
MRGSDLTPQEIAARTGVPYSTVCRWNLVQNWRPAVLRAREAHRPQKWSDARVAALARVARVPGVDPGDLAEALGARRDRAESLFRACGLSETIAPQSAVGRAQRRAGPDGALRTALRVHLARQIGELDALLIARGREDDLIRLERAGKLDTAKMLRNLVGLKKLLDEVEPASEGGPEEKLDLVALRADIARRYETFAAQRQEARSAAWARAHAAAGVPLEEEAFDLLGERIARGVRGATPADAARGEAAPGDAGQGDARAARDALRRGAGGAAGQGAEDGQGEGGEDAARHAPRPRAQAVLGPRIRAP